MGRGGGSQWVGGGGVERGKSQLVGGVGRCQWVGRGGEGSVGGQEKGMGDVENGSGLSK